MDYQDYLLSKLPTGIQLTRGEGGWTASTLENISHGFGPTIKDALLALSQKLGLVR